MAQTTPKHTLLISRELPEQAVELARSRADVSLHADVFEEEPKVHPDLLGLPNVVLAPHIASASNDTRLKMAQLAVENCLAVLEGAAPPTPVNPEVLTRKS